jgi:hypothetical protein
MAIETTPNGFRIDRRDDGIWFYVPDPGSWRRPGDAVYYYDAEADELYCRAHVFWVAPGNIHRDVAKYEPKLKRWWPVGYVYDRRCYWDKPNHVFINGKYWHVDDPNKPAVVMRFKDVGLNLRESSLGCGTKQLYNFEFGTSDTKAVAAMFELELKPYRQGMTGIILAVLNPTQNPVYGPILLAAGFELLSTHTNYMHNHPNYLYGFKCMDNKAIIDEKERAFG